MSLKAILEPCFCVYCKEYNKFEAEEKQKEEEKKKLYC